LLPDNTTHTLSGLFGVAKYEKTVGTGINCNYPLLTIIKYFLNLIIFKEVKLWLLKM